MVDETKTVLLALSMSNVWIFIIFREVYANNGPAEVSDPIRTKMEAGK